MTKKAEIKLNREGFKSQPVRKLTYKNQQGKYNVSQYPVLILGNKEIAKRYGWNIGDKVGIDYEQEGIFIYKLKIQEHD